MEEGVVVLAAGGGATSGGGTGAVAESWMGGARSDGERLPTT
jgi:hypothetical protein